MQRSSLPLDEILAKYDWISSVTLPPDVTSLLHDNVAPSPLRTTQLKASLKGLTIALGEIDGDIDKFRDVVRSLEAHRLCLQSLKNDYETILVPIRRIPEEITMEILRRSWKVDKYMGMWSGRRIAGFNVFEVQEGPWHLGQVCSSWRNIIKTLCPELWASMTIRIPHACEPKVPLGADTTVEMLRVALERSRNHPLDFHFSCYDPLHYSEAEEGISQSMKQCFDIMIAHSDRWRAVEMRIHPSYLPRLSLVRGKIDLLRDMYIDCIDNPPSGHIWAFEIAPKLEILHLKGMHNEADIPFPASNLVSFSDARLFAGDRLTPTYLAVMKPAPKLLSFSYNGYGIQSLHNHPVPDPPSPVIASSVEKLSASSPSFLRSLVLPSLKEVTLTTMYENDMEERVITCPVGALGALHQMLLQSQCSLTRLCLVDADLNDNLVNIMRLIPRLEEFTIEFYQWVPDIAENHGAIMQSLVTHLSEVSMVDGSLQHSMVPFLKELTIDMHTIRYAHVSFINSAFVDMVASRVRRPRDIPHLTRLRLSVMGRGWSYALDKVAKKTLKNLRSEGLNLDFFLDDRDPASESDSDSESDGP